MGMKEIILYFVSFIFLEAGYPLLQLEEYITGVDGCEKYDLGVLTYLGTPTTAGYLSLFCLS